MIPKNETEKNDFGHLKMDLMNINKSHLERNFASGQRKKKEF